MKNVVMFFIAALIVGFSGCSSKTLVSKCNIEGGAPEWVCSGGANYKDGIYAVGSAQKSPLGISFQRAEATAQARDEIAREIGVKIKNMIKNYYSSTGAGDNQTAERVVTNVSKQLTKQLLEGSKIVKTWISPKGTMYVLVKLDKNKVKNIIKTTFKNDEALWQEFKAKKAQEELDRAIEKEFK
jgi:ribosomal protein S20